MRRGSYAMRTPPEILKYCERRYFDLLRAIVENRSIFPLEIRFGKTKRPTDFESLRQAVTALAKSGLEFNIEWKDTNTRKWGRQRLPTRIWFEEEHSFLRAVEKAKEIERFRENISLIRRECPKLEDWLSSNAACVINEDGAWSTLLEICQYFLRHPRPGLYVRELPISADTKFVEAHMATIANLLSFLLPDNASSHTMRFEERYGLRFDEPLLRLRFLDDEWRRHRGFPVTDLSVPLREFVRLRLEGCNAFIAENKINFLTLPAMKFGIGIFGGGEGVQLLAKAAWLRNCNLIYWGDIDSQGFSILSRLRTAFPGVISVMMDDKTLDTFRGAVVRGVVSREPAPGNLTPEEQHVYNRMAAGSRLEQEKIPFDYATVELKTAVSRFLGSSNLPVHSPN
jgi:hypothetical protein